MKQQLVGGLEHEWISFPYIGNNHPNIFFRGVGIPPTRTKSKANETAILQQLEPPVKSRRSRLQRVVKIIVHAESAVLWKWHDGNVSWHCLIVAGEAYATMLISVGLVSMLSLVASLSPCCFNSPPFLVKSPCFMASKPHPIWKPFPLHRFKKAHVTHPELKMTFCLEIVPLPGRNCQWVLSTSEHFEIPPKFHGLSPYISIWGQFKIGGPEQAPGPHPFHTSVPYLLEGSVPYLCSIPLIHTLLYI